MVKPFIKWAGGKNQLLTEIRRTYPIQLGKKIDRYCEPFIGGGAVFFDILNNYSLNEIYINDINTELINTYKMIQQNVCELIGELEKLQYAYLPLQAEGRKEFYTEMRIKFNDLKVNGNETVNLEKAVLFIFLNKTCFNGLFRVNSRGLFNVPMGAYKNPLICDKDNLIMVSKSLQNVEIQCGDYSNSANFVTENTFVYIDPPYRPLTETANFTSYNETAFNDNEQIRLANFVNQLDELGAKVVVSNSDPKNSDSEDQFFDELYGAFTIDRISANRMINCNGDNRGKIRELLICNY